ncbi:MAG: fatty acid CoA ligase family protein [Opitutales bacterium]
MPYNVAHFLVKQAAGQPDRAAVRAPDGRLSDGSIRYKERSFAELESEASAAAHLFQSSGVHRGTRVLLMVRPGLDLIRIVFALFKIGAVPIVIDPGMGLKRFLRCVRHTQPEAIIGIPAAIWIARLFRSSFSGVRTKLSINRCFESKLRAQAHLAGFPVVDSKGDELAAILFTSGSTGPAKGVLYEHGMFLAQVEAIQSQYGIEPGEVDLPMLPVFALFNPALGMCTVVPEMNPSRPALVNPEKIVLAVRQNQVTNTFGSPALWTKIARYCTSRGITLPSIRRILMAGAPVPPSLMEQMTAVIPNGEIHTPYGATEALPVSSIAASEVLSTTAELTRSGGGTCVGQPLPGVSVRVIEPVAGPVPTMAAARQLEPGEVGELVVRGPSVTRGYDHLPDADAKAKIDDGRSFWHRMGDLGRIDELGRIWFYGRVVERVLTEQGALYTECCEAILNQHPRVFRSALVDLGEGQPAMIIEPQPGCYPKKAKQRAAFIHELTQLAQQNRSTERITQFRFEKCFPVDVRHNAKIHRLALAKKYAGR